MLMSETSVISASSVSPVGEKVLVEQAARSVKWSILYNVVPRLVTPFSTMILAALLTPADFGLVAVSAFVLALARIVVELGLGKAVIQRKEKVFEAATISLWINLFAAFAIFCLLWFLAPELAVAYGTPAITSVVRLSALALPLMAVQTVPKAMLQRKMEFRSLFWVNTSFLVIQSVASVILAILGLKAWAIIWGQLIGLLSSALLAWLLGQWRPGKVTEWSLVRPILKFSTWIMASGFQNWLYLYADNVIAGLFLGVHGLGVYALGFNIATLIPTFLVASLDDVAYPAFCKLQEDPHKVGIRLVQLQSLVAAILLPLAFGMSAVAAPAIHLLYGNKWDGLGMVIGFLAVMPGISPIWALNQNAYQAIGKPSLWTKLAGFSLLVVIPSLWVAAPYGLFIFVLVRFVVALILPLGNILIGARTLSIGAREQVRGLVVPIVLSTIMYIGLLFLLRALSPFEGITGWLRLMMVVVVGGAAYLLMVRVLAVDLWKQLLSGARRVLAR
jgi:O-antigen/teichoic acid export membrane protein